jgi:hypothetical protein
LVDLFRVGDVELYRDYAWFAGGQVVDGLDAARRRVHLVGAAIE